MKYLNILFIIIITLVTLSPLSYSDRNSSGGEYACHCLLIKKELQHCKSAYIIDCNCDNKNIASHVFHLKTTIYGNINTRVNSIQPAYYTTADQELHDTIILSDTPPPRPIV